MLAWVVSRSAFENMFHIDMFYSRFYFS
jgi:hypothetical protein